MAPTLEVEFLQRVHAAEPVDPLYLPAAHPVHGTPTVLAVPVEIVFEGVFPARQKHSPTSELPTGDVLPVGQLWHSPSALGCLNFPAAQGLQSISCVLAVNCVLVPPGQAVQLPAPVKGL